VSRSLSSLFLAQIAAEYADEVSKGNSAPNMAIAQRHQAEKRTVESWVYKARARGLMAPAVHVGRPTIHPQPKARTEAEIKAEALLEVAAWLTARAVSLRADA